MKHSLKRKIKYYSFLSMVFLKMVTFLFLAIAIFSIIENL